VDKRGPRQDENASNVKKGKEGEEDSHDDIGHTVVLLGIALLGIGFNVPTIFLASWTLSFEDHGVNIRP
jgi:hypothetical protein